MKKIFTLIAAAVAALSMNAADITVYFGDTPVQDGDTYTIGYDLVKTEYPEYGFTQYDWLQDSNLFVDGAAGTDITMELHADAVLQVCSFDGLCQMVSDTKKVGKLAGGKESVQVEKVTTTMDPTPPAMETITANFTFTSGSTVINCTVVMTNEEAGISNISADTEADGPVYNLQGIMVAKSMTNDLPAGLYISKGKKFLKK